jgi:hypothetical protein
MMGSPKKVIMKPPLVQTISKAQLEKYHKRKLEKQIEEELNISREIA